jgi:diketogulonate reductase-like aldo/keto reductase
VAQDVGRSAAQVALAWLRQQPGVVIPIIGARTPAQLKDNLGSLAFTLEKPQLKKLNEASRIEMGFPNDFFALDMVRGYAYGGMYDQIDDHRLK